jgi:hypothetical protein
MRTRKFFIAADNGRRKFSGTWFMIRLKATVIKVCPADTQRVEFIAHASRAVHATQEKMSMINFHSRLLPAGLLGFASVAQAHPGHTEHAAGLPPGWHAVYHWMEMAAISPGFGIGMMALGVLLYAAGATRGTAWRLPVVRIARFTGFALGGGGLWLLLG